MGRLPIFFLKLMLDRKIPIKYKLLPALGLAYVILPFDFVPDMLPILGFLDDIIILVGTIIIFMIFGPLRKLSDTMKNSKTKEKRQKETDIVEGEYRIIDEPADSQ
jgi:carbonic anhydrase